MEKYLDRKVLWIHEHNMETLLLEKIYPGRSFIHNKSLKECNIKTRPDFRCEDLKIIFEYDGPRHYTESQMCVKDITKRQVYRDLGYKVIEWPYYIQPCTSVLKAFEINVEFKQLYPQGFNEKGVITPADFCYLGLERFKKELELFKEVLPEIGESLQRKLKEGYDPRVLVPKEFEYLLHPSSIPN